MDTDAVETVIAVDLEHVHRMDIVMDLRNVIKCDYDGRSRYSVV